ncbi:MAG: hypothetical protein HZB83_01805 [Deltaproteobacteria bacterium]|nr:hypothetical protein [Deltaproteobacteria bacterium]
MKDIAPEYKERPWRDKPFGKKDTKPGAPHKAERFASKEKKGRPQPWKKTVPAVSEKRAVLPGNKPERRTPKRPHHDYVPTLERGNDNKETRPMRQGERPDRPRRPVGEHRARPAERPLPTHVKAEAKAHPAVSEKKEIATKGARGGILKRLFKFLKKS